MSHPPRMSAGVSRVLRSPVAQFLVAGLVTLVVLVVVTGSLSGRAAREEALTDARASTEVLAHSVAEPAIPRGLVAGRAGAIDRYDREMLTRLVVGEVQRIKIWARDGTIVYSDEARLIGDRFDLGPEEAAIMEDGGSEAEVSDLARPENRYEPRGTGLVEVYTRIEAPDGVPLLFEAYYSADDIEARRAEVIAPFRSITIGALVALVLVATPMLWVLTRRLTRAAAERERLLRSAADASDAERRRVARDLHDGVVQDLAGASFTVSALARETTDGVEREALDGVGSSLRGILRSLRSLLVEIHPPRLFAGDLRAALDDLTAPAASSGVDVRVDVTGLGGVPDDAVALVWRVAQEAVRNALRHARAGRLDVVVRRAPTGIELEVTDDGVGFDPSADRADTHYGLRGLDSLVQDHGGGLQVVSAPGRGTRVVLHVDLRSRR